MFNLVNRLPKEAQRPNNTDSQFDYDDGLHIETASENLSGSAADHTYTFTYNPASQIKTLSVSNQNYAVDHLAQGTPGKYVTNGLN